MTDNEIDEEIVGSPGKSDLEIALALDTTEDSVKRRRAFIDKKVDAEAEAKQKAKPEKPIEKVEEPKELKEPEPTPVPPSEPKAPKEKKPSYFYQAEDGSSIELKVVSDNGRVIIFERK